jgi:tRNA(Ile)-lysidine synthase
MNEAFAFEQSVLGTIRTHALIGPGHGLVVAVSGGPDSSALLAALHALCARGALDASLLVAHLDHGLRGAEGERDAAFVRALAARLAVPSVVERADLLAGGAANREARARDARYAFLHRVAETHGAARICVAHTRDDQAETVLLRLARGGGPASLAAMAYARADGVVRPLLDLDRAACIAYLRARSLPWVVDSSNEDETLFRNRVRRRLLPLLERELGVDVRGRLARLAAQLAQESALAERMVAVLLAQHGAGRELPLAALRDAGAGAPRLVHAWLVRGGVRASARQVSDVLGLAAAARPSGALDLRGGRVVRRYDVLVLGAPGEERPGPRPAPVALGVPGSAALDGWRITSESCGAASPDARPGAGPADSTTVDLERLAAPLAVRAPRPGDRVRLAHGRRKLADILIDARVPRRERKDLAVVACGDEVVWVPGVVRSVVAAADAASRRLAVLRAERRPGVE